MTHFAFRDFAPKQKRPAGFFQSAEFDNLMDAVLQANLWVRDHQVKVLNIETVVLPNILEREKPVTEEATMEGSVATYEGISHYNHWYQFIRVWYEFDEKPREPREQEKSK
ncbi:hypothetical protein [Armatimonas rosea]|uniref:Uncharacterized protein n=1 Tax=Armatimonas rosea TaxID=685828 RepID=A0A7W9STA6_ARMRO|nr:hypothetical protein [Armatimonas rosea]MBB6051643.1 hypothetical protein [Armatimonas rosea]